jgi:hypothetical protein
MVLPGCFLPAQDHGGLWFLPGIKVVRMHAQGRLLRSNQGHTISTVKKCQQECQQTPLGEGKIELKKIQRSYP